MTQLMVYLSLQLLCAKNAQISRSIRFFAVHLPQRESAMALVNLISLVIRSAALLVVSGFTYILLRTLYRLSPIHPLSKLPGPYLPRISSLWLTYHAWIGDECSRVHKLHQKYGPIVRTGPYSVDVADGKALQNIYVQSGGFRKPAFYGNFDIDGHKSIFSEIAPERRAPRAKAVVSLFSTASLRAGSDVLDDVVGKFVSRLKAEKTRCSSSSSGSKCLDVLNLTRGLALDVVTGYLFGRSFGGLDPPSDHTHGKKSNVDEEIGMAANGMVDLFVGVGRFWYLPSWAFQWVDYFDAKFGKGSSKTVERSLGHVDGFVAEVVDEAVTVLENEKGTGRTAEDGVTSRSYPARLLAAGLSVSETRAQCKDLIFAGSDSTGMNVATIIFYLVRDQMVLANLEKELREHKDVSDIVEIQSLPYLRGVVREGLRLSMANPSRLPRVVPSSGWQFNGTDFPGGSEVSCTPFELHLNASVFPDPDEFRPERWAEDEPTLKEMERDAIPFGLGSRQCIARNLATVELFMAVKAIVESGVLIGARPAKGAHKIEILEWFNSHVIGGKIEIEWA